MLSCKILFVLSISSRQVNRALAFDETHYRRYCILGRYRKQHVHMVSHQMTFQYATFLLLGQTSEYLAQMRPEAFIQHLAATLRDKGHMVFALPYRVA